ncbi:MAG: peptidoglycan-binding domain-containing protein [Rhodobacterales bacterium]
MATGPEAGATEQKTPMTRPCRATRLAFSLSALAALTACTPTVGDTTAMALVGSMQDTPPGASEGTCWGRIVSPALIETVTEQILVQPASAATDAGPGAAAIYRTETRQRIVNEREVTWFEAPCPDDMTTEAIATLQRALAVRDFYDGPVTGQIDAATSAAVGRYQASTGLQSRVLALSTARALGVLATPIEELNAD